MLSKTSVFRAFHVLTLALLLAACAAQFVRADEILVGTAHQVGLCPPSGCQFPATSPVGNGSASAQEFSLDRPVTVTGFNLAVFSSLEDAQDTFIFQLTDKIGTGADQDNVLASVSVSGGQLPVAPCGPAIPCLPDLLSLSITPLKLKPGEYFLVGWEPFNPNVIGRGAAWAGDQNVLPSTVGEIGPSFSSFDANLNNPPGSTFAPNPNLTGQQLGFQLIGTTHSVPEPPGYALWLGALVVFAAVRRK